MSATHTPMFQQYHALKAQHPDCVLFFRMGDFYEMFYDDAELAGQVLELTVTARNKQDPEPIPMAGVPHHAAAGYVQRFTEAGYRVAIAEQVEDPALAKGLVKREVVRVVTPGVVLDPSALEARAPNYLVALAGDMTGPGVGVAFVDVSTGDFRSTHVADVDAAIGEVHRMEPKEALLSGDLAKSGALVDALRRHRTVISDPPAELWSERRARDTLEQVLGADDARGLDLADGELVAAGVALAYCREVSGSALGNVHELRPYRTGGFMVVDDTTTRNLELARTLIGNRRKGSLLGLLDRCATAMGSRMTREWLSFPLLDPGAITARSAAVAALAGDPDRRGALRKALREVADIERIAARVSQGTAHARDLAGLRRSLLAAPAAVATVGDLAPLRAHLPADVMADVARDLCTWLAEDPPISLTDGGIIASGAHAELDELIDIGVQGVGVITKLEQREREATGIATLKVRRNKVFGYFIEVTRAHLHKVPERFLRKQTLTNAERYITAELKELEEKVLGADERRKTLEYALFVELRERVGVQGERLSALARSLASLDALANLAEVAIRRRWVRPGVDSGTKLDIVAGRHPVVEALLDEERFVPNDTQLDADGKRMIVLTGPNMAGKSTIMRQTALIVLLAQMGSFVPADAAHIGVCDRIFTRVGASDDLTRGQSTFMVEMAETSVILQHASERSLVLLDEIGRGTSTYDGLSIAWAVAEDISQRVRCRALFATHYHELCELAATHPGVINMSVAIRDQGDRIIFLRRLKEGGASRSYGIQCARLAGLPDGVVDRARALLNHFEKHAPRNEREQLSLFGTVRPQAEDIGEVAPPAAAAPVSAVESALAAIDPDALSPREALDALYTLKGLA